MKGKIAALLCVGFLPITVFAQAPDTLWTKRYGGIDREYGASVYQMSDGGYIIGAETESFSGGDCDIWFIRTDSTGDTLWTRTYGGPGEECCRALQPTYDGGYIATGSRRPEQASIRIYVVKTDSIGDTLWTQEYGPKSVSYSIEQTSDSGYIIAGSVFIGSNEDIYLIKVDSLGDTLWTKRYGGTSRDYTWSVAQTIDGGYIVGGITGSFGAGSYDIWLLKLDADGDTVWTRTYGGASWDYALSVQQTSDGGYVVAGRTNSFCIGYCDVWLLKTNPNGDTIWTKTYGGIDAEGARTVRQTTDGGYIVVGWTYSFGHGETDVYLLKTDANGDTLWTTTYGGTRFDHGEWIQQTSDRGYVIVGSNGSHEQGDSDVWLIKLAPDTLGILEQRGFPIERNNISETILSGPLLLPEGKQCRVFDITGRIVTPDKMRPGIYFIEIDGNITRKIVRVR